MSVLVLTGQRIRIDLKNDLRIVVSGPEGQLLWESSHLQKPSLLIAIDSRLVELPLVSAKNISSEVLNEGPFRGHRLQLSNYDQADITVSMFLGIDASRDELLVQVEQLDGSHTISAIQNLYRFEKPTNTDGYLVVPHGSGYLIPSNCSEELPGSGDSGGIVGARWTLPLFGIVSDRESLCAIVDSWWDCDVVVEHIPNKHSAIAFNWASSLDKLAYPRRLFLRFADNMDYVDMAKEFRKHAIQSGLARSLTEKSESTPNIKKYVNNILYRWPAWNPTDGPSVLEDVKRLVNDGLGINFFYPKWPPSGYSPEQGTPTAASGTWQAYLHPDPVHGGWPTLVNLERKLHELNCLVQGFVCPIKQDPKGPDYNLERESLDAEGKRQDRLSCDDALDRIKRVFDSIEHRGLTLDVMYFDGFSAHTDLPQNFSLAQPVTRRTNIEAQLSCFSETRSRGIIPGAELARFWAIGECDYFFFTDWAHDRLTNEPSKDSGAPVGHPIPLFQLVFNDCFIAGFSGGGYKAYADGYDWWNTRTPRLYELMYAAAPSYNWLPYPVVPMVNWGSEQQRNKTKWLSEWSNYFRAVAFSEMVTHQSLDNDRAHQRIEFANGVSAEFDFLQNRFRITGVDSFCGKWEDPPVL